MAQAAPKPAPLSSFIIEHSQREHMPMVLKRFSATFNQHLKSPQTVVPLHFKEFSQSLDAQGAATRCAATLLSYKKEETLNRPFSPAHQKPFTLDLFYLLEHQQNAPIELYYYTEKPVGDRGMNVPGKCRTLPINLTLLSAFSTDFDTDTQTHVCALDMCAHSFNCYSC